MKNEELIAEAIRGAARQWYAQKVASMDNFADEDVRIHIQSRVSRLASQTAARGTGGNEYIKMMADLACLITLPSEHQGALAEFLRERPEDVMLQVAVAIG